MIEATYPLSPLQQGMLFHHLYSPHSGVDIEQIVCTLRENLNIPALEQAWQQTLQQHAILRTTFRWQDIDQPLQEVQASVACSLMQEDWRNLSAHETQAQLDSFLQSDRQRGFEL